MENDLIVLKQVPIIAEKLKMVSEEIDKQTQNAIALECNEETKTIVKKTRAELNKEFQQLEEKRKELKTQIIKPYDDFMEQVYEPLISSKFKNADTILKDKISSVENELLQEKKNEIENYFKDYAQSNEVDFLDISMTKINILLSKSNASLKNECKEFIDKIVNDLKVIELQENKTEILVEYKNNLNLALSIQIVENRHKQLEIEKQKEIERQKALEIETQNIQQVEEIVAPMEIEEPKEQEQEYEMTFKVKGTLQELKLLKEFLIANNIKFEKGE